MLVKWFEENAFGTLSFGMKMKHWQNVACCAIFAPVAEHSSFVDFPDVPAKKDMVLPCCF